MSEDPLNVSLREITRENYKQVIQLSVQEEQKHFVASNVYSLAEAYVYRHSTPLAIYAGETPVGFLMYGFWEERQEYWIIRLMIAAGQQKRGYGRAAMGLCIERMKALPECWQIFISYEPENNVARALYQGLGFQITGEIVEGEEVARLDLA